MLFAYQTKWKGDQATKLAGGRNVSVGRRRKDQWRSRCGDSI